MTPTDLPTLDIEVHTTFFSVQSADWPKLKVNLQAERDQVLSHFTSRMLMKYLEKNHSQALQQWIDENKQS